MDFELDVQLSGSKQYTNEENYVITCDPLKVCLVFSLNLQMQEKKTFCMFGIKKM